MSVTGSIRKRIGLAKGRLGVTIDRLSSKSYVFEPNYEHSTYEDNVSKAEETIKETRAEIEKIKQGQKKISDLEKEWLSVVQSLPVDFALKERAIYDQTGSAEDSYIDTLERAEVLIEKLENQLSEIKKSLKQFKQEQNSVLSSSASSLSQTKTQKTISPLPSEQNSIKTQIEISEIEPIVHMAPVIDMPKLSLQNFNGDIMHWTTFWETFESAIHVQSIPNVQKFAYLLSCLRGPALEAIAGIAVTNINYPLAIEELKRRFGRPALIKHHLHSELRRLPQCSDKTRDLRNTLEQINRICRQLENLGEQVDHPLTVMTVESKLPKAVLYGLYSKRKDGWSLKELREHLDDYIQLKEDVNRVYRDNVSEQKAKKGETHSLEKAFVQESSAMVITHKEKEKGSGYSKRERPKEKPKNEKAKPTYPCAFCEETHWNSECSTFRTVKERTKRAIEINLCLKCLRPGHYLRDCRSKRKCYFCKGQHNEAFCRKQAPYVEDSSKEKPKPESSSKKRKNSDTAMNCLEVSDTAKSLLLTAKSDVFNPSSPKEKFYACIFLDNGSQKSFITEKMASKLKLLPIEQQRLKLNTFGKKSEKILSDRTEIGVVLKNGEEMQMEVNVVPAICGKLPTYNSNGITIQTQLITTKMAEPDVLIGIDYYWTFMNNTIIQQLPSGFHQVETKLGPIICGKGKMQNVENHVLSLNEAETKIDVPENNKDDMEKFWALETIGIHDSHNQSDDETALEMFQKTIKFVEGRYLVKWPFKNPNPDLPSNFGLAYGRLKTAYNRLAHDDLLQKYNAIFEEQMGLGIIEEAPKATINLIHYLPHQPVYRSDKNFTKIRIVFDASSKMRKTLNSLNDVIFKGPAILPDLCGMLLRFRMYKYVMLSDIEKAFLQLGLAETDRDVTRFLWIKDTSKPPENNNLVIYRFKRVAFGINASPFLLAATVRHHLSQYPSSKLAQAIKENIYVDNVLMHADSIDEAKSKYEESKSIFKEANMNLREFVSNDTELNQFLQKKENWLPATEKTKMLGIPWDYGQDQLFIKMKIEQTKEPWTKRKTLAAIASIYDPLGFVSAATVQLKIFCQSLWKRNLDWDDTIPAEDQNVWKNLVENWSGTEVKLSRRISMDKQSQLHIFADASQKAYAAVAYSKTGQEIDFLFGKSRLNPVKELTIPKLELMAVLIATRIAKFVQTQMKLDFSRVVIWTDSSCVLGWLNSEKTQMRFVENRLKEIKLTKCEFRYVPTQDNPADIASRGISPEELVAQQKWWKGPNWLPMSENEWPKLNGTSNHIQIINETSETMAVEVTTMPEKIEQDLIGKRFNDYQKLIWTVMWILRYIKIMLGKSPNFGRIVSLGEMFSTKGPFTIHDHEAAQIVVMKLTQKTTPPTPKEIKTLRLFKDEHGLLRCETRLENSKLPHASKQPLFLPKKNKNTNLIIVHEHNKLMHAGATQTLVSLRKQYWIPQGKRTVKKAIGNCFVCKKYEARPYRLPEIPSYPMKRVIQSYPFQHCGLDYFGPINVKEETITSKVWVLLLTCFTTRAVHLEVVSNLSTMTFLNGFRRFVARRGLPQSVLSDNAPHFKLANQILAKVLSEDKSIGRFMIQNSIKWTFTPEYAPWAGGMYERMVQIVKNALRRSIGRKLLNTEQLQTFMCEAEAVVNCRPIVQPSNDFEPNRALRPVDFLAPMKEIQIPGNRDNEEEEYLPPDSSSADKLKSLWDKTLSSLNKFWEAWHSDYLLSLNERAQREHKQSRLALPAVPRKDEIVLIKEEQVPRGEWKLGRIVELSPSADNSVRSAIVELANKNKMRRPINHLFRLEVEYNSEENVDANAVLASADSKTTKRKSRAKFFLLLLSACIAVACGEQCKVNDRTQRQYAPKCLKSGPVIFKRPDESLCYQTMNCSTGYLSIDGLGYCSSGQCTCDPWATQCSFYQGPSISESTINLENVKNALKTNAPQICSTQKTDECNSGPIKRDFNQIKLYDGTKHLVEQLHIKEQETISRNEVLCYGDGLITGTNDLCEYQTCYSNGTRFCLRNPYSVLYYVADTMDILIMAYGSVEKEIYEHVPVIPVEPRSGLAIITTCEQGGAQVLNIENGTQSISVCGGRHCITVQKPNSKEKIEFPPEVIIYPFEVKTKAWKLGKEIDLGSIKCDPQPYCEMITCTVCWALIRNPSCITKVNWAYVLVALYLAVFVIYYFIKVLILSCKALSVLLKCCGCKKCFSWMKWPNCFKRKLQITPPARLNRRRALRRLGTVALIFAFVAMVRGCHEITSLTANQNACITFGNGSQSCVYNEATQLTMLPGHTACLHLKSKENSIVGSLKLSVESLAAECQMKSEYFTRHIKIEARSTKRCPGMGSCTGDYCGNINANGQIEEFSKSENGAPGKSACSESCGGWQCGCISFESGCLFYRVFAKPESSVVYEVFSCPTWVVRANVKLVIEMAGQSKTELITLRPGVPTKSGEQTLTLGSTSPALLPILGYKFVKSSNNEAIIINDPALLRNRLVCQNQAQAQAFNCQFPNDACQCTPTQSKMNCRCENDPLPKMFKNADQRIPVRSAGVEIKFENNVVEASIQQTTAIQIQLSINQMTAIVNYNSNKCTIGKGNLVGCYNCMQGAQWTATCTTDFGSAMANIRCPSVEFSLLCDEKITNRTAVLMLSQGAINEECEVHCPGGTSKTTISGALFYLESEYIDSDNTEDRSNSTKGGLKRNPINDIVNFVSDVMSNNWLSFLTLIPLAIILFIVSLLVIPGFPVIVSNCLKSKLSKKIVVSRSLGSVAKGETKRA